MTITYSFKITSINRLILYVDEENNEYNNLITKINFYYQGIDDDNIMAIYNSCISLPKPKTSDYKNYNDLTENDILGKVIKTGETVYGIVGIRSDNYDTIKVK